MRPICLTVLRLMVTPSFLGCAAGLCAPSLKWGHNRATHSDPLDRRLDQPFGLRVLNELARIRRAEIPSLRYRHGVRINAGPTVKNARTRELIRHLKQGRFNAGHDVGSPGFERLHCARVT